MIEDVSRSYANEVGERKADKRLKDNFTSFAVYLVHLVS